MSSLITHDLLAAILRRLRPLDIAVATKIHCGTPLAARPSLEELLQAPARLFWLAAFVSHAQSQNHSGLLLESSVLIGDCLRKSESDFPLPPVKLLELLGPLGQLAKDFPAQLISEQAAAQSPSAPFVYRSEVSLVYFHRWYAMEAELGAHIRQRLKHPPRALPASLKKAFARYFAPAEIQGNPWQAVACLSALRSNLALITGGPGTGKTTTITRLVALLLELPESEQPQRIRMVAPSGKAADRMRESFALGFQNLLSQAPAEETQALQTRVERALQTSSTIHAFLGARGKSGFTHHAGNPVDCDLLIVDEATMVPLDIFLALFQALPANCRIVLLGDKNQLAAVETGNVFYDLTSSSSEQPNALNAFTANFRESFKSFTDIEVPTAETASPLCGDNVTELVKSYRFSGDSPVGQLARLLLSEQRLPRRTELSAPLASFAENWQTPLKQAVAAYRSALRSSPTPEPAQLLDLVGRFRILCATRHGEQGVDAINRLLAEEVLGGSPDLAYPRHGLPFIIRKNDKNIGLWNGDCGLFLEDERGTLKAYLPARADGEQPRSLNPFAIPEWDPAFAITIHLSQGSEYDSVIVVLPDRSDRFLSWELVYTGVTRAKQNVQLLLPPEKIGSPLPKTQRISGLALELEG